jgi:hypothetical protein
VHRYIYIKILNLKEEKYAVLLSIGTMDTAILFTVVIFSDSYLLTILTANITNDTISSGSLSYTRMHANNSTNYII